MPVPNSFMKVVSVSSGALIASAICEPELIVRLPVKVSAPLLVLVPGLSWPTLVVVVPMVVLPAMVPVPESTAAVGTMPVVPILTGPVDLRLLTTWRLPPLTVVAPLKVSLVPSWIHVLVPVLVSDVVPPAPLLVIAAEKVFATVLVPVRVRVCVEPVAPL